MTAALMASDQAQRLLEEVIYERVVELVDLDGMWRLEQMLALAMCEASAATAEQATAEAKQMVDRAWHRLADDPRRYMMFGGAPLDDCGLCQEEGRPAVGRH